MTGIEPALSAWEADVLPLNYIRLTRHFVRTPAVVPPPCLKLWSTNPQASARRQCTAGTEPEPIALWLATTHKNLIAELVSPIRGKPDSG